MKDGRFRCYRNEGGDETSSIVRYSTSCPIGRVGAQMNCFRCSRMPDCRKPIPRTCRFRPRDNMLFQTTASFDTVGQPMLSGCCRFQTGATPSDSTKARSWTRRPHPSKGTLSATNVIDIFAIVDFSGDSESPDSTASTFSWHRPVVIRFASQ